jgi:hypothetical protein
MKQLMVFSALLLATASSNAATWTNGTQIVENIIWRPGYHGFYVSSSTYHDPESCGSGGGGSRLYLIDPSVDEKTVDRLYAMLMTAFAAGKTVYVWVDGCTDSIPKFTGLQVNN